MEEKIVCAGFGAQGIMVLGKLLVYAGMNQNLRLPGCLLIGQR